MLWVWFTLSFVIAGLSFPAMPFRADERDLFWKALDLQIKDADDGVDWSDSLEQGWLKLEQPGRFLHDLKGIGNRWVQENHKVAFKGFGFVFDVLIVLFGIGWTT